MLKANPRRSPAQRVRRGKGGRRLRIWSFRGSHAYRGNGMQQPSSDVKGQIKKNTDFQIRCQSETNIYLWSYLLFLVTPPDGITHRNLVKFNRNTLENEETARSFSDLFLRKAPTNPPFGGKAGAFGFLVPGYACPASRVSFPDPRATFRRRLQLRNHARRTLRSCRSSTTASDSAGR